MFVVVCSLGVEPWNEEYVVTRLHCLESWASDSYHIPVANFDSKLLRCFPFHNPWWLRLSFSLTMAWIPFSDFGGTNYSSHFLSSKKAIWMEFQILRWNGATCLECDCSFLEGASFPNVAGPSRETRLPFETASQSLPHHLGGSSSFRCLPPCSSPMREITYVLLVGRWSKQFKF